MSMVKKRRLFEKLRVALSAVLRKRERFYITRTFCWCNILYVYARTYNHYTVLVARIASPRSPQAKIRLECLWSLNTRKSCSRGGTTAVWAWRPSTKWAYDMAKWIVFIEVRFSTDYTKITIGWFPEMGSKTKCPQEYHLLSWSKRLECFAKQDPGRARQSS